MDALHIQKATEAQITKILADDESVKGLVLVGSHARSDIVPDVWSDLDFAVIVDNQSVSRFYPTTDWTTQFGDLYAVDLSSAEHYRVLRAQYTDGRRMDFIIISESSLLSIDQWTRNPLQFENRCLFSRSAQLDKVLNRSYAERVFKKHTSEQLQQMANGFWFKGMLAATKVARKELLVAAHLGLDMIRDCLVLAMMIRDQATGTDHHRDGSQGNHLIELLKPPLREYTTQEVLNSIKRSAITFETLAVQLDINYKDHRKPLLDFIEQVRDSLLENE